MDYVATEFLPLADLPPGTADLVRAQVGSDAAWEQLVTQHDDRAAALLAVCGALSRTVLSLKDGRSIGGLEMVLEIKELAGDRAYVLVTAERSVRGAMVADSLPSPARTGASSPARSDSTGAARADRFTRASTSRGSPATATCRGFNGTTATAMGWRTSMSTATHPGMSSTI